MLSIGGHSQAGTLAFAIMVVFAIFLLAGDRSDTVRALRGGGRDERFELIHLKAATLARVSCRSPSLSSTWSKSRAATPGSPYDWLSALGGATLPRQGALAAQPGLR